MTMPIEEIGLLLGLRGAHIAPVMWAVGPMRWALCHVVGNDTAMYQHPGVGLLIGNTREEAERAVMEAVAPSRRQRLRECCEEAERDVMHAERMLQGCRDRHRAAMEALVADMNEEAP